MIYVVWFTFKEYDHAYSFETYDHAMRMVHAGQHIVGIERIEVTNDERDHSFYDWHAI